MTGTLARRVEQYFDRLWPICRSLTGPGYRESLDILGEIMPTDRLRFETGRRVFDWVVPNEWRVRDAYFVDPHGVRRAHFAVNNLHLLGYSTPFRGRMRLSDLGPHLYSLPHQPNAIPYLTSYYQERWGFCLAHEELVSLPDGEYEVVVDTELRPGHLEVGEAVLPGETADEVLFSSYLCHPSLANNELSGPLTLAFLYEQVAAIARRRFTYRFVVTPETLGAICYLSARGGVLRERLRAGYQLTCIGDAGQFTYKLSRRGHTDADRAARFVLRDLGAHEIIPFDPYEGSDERQYCSPGFDLPVGALMRTRYLRYPEYHTSLDNKSLISFEALADAVSACVRIVRALESNLVWQNTVMYGEPQLGRRGLYSTIGGLTSVDDRNRAMLWLLNLADGSRDLLAIAESSGQRLDLLASLAADLALAGLLVPAAGPPGPVTPPVAIL
jgi:aminopeptidase-like protein